MFEQISKLFDISFERKNGWIFKTTNYSLRRCTLTVRLFIISQLKLFTFDNIFGLNTWMGTVWIVVLVDQTDVCLSMPFILNLRIYGETQNYVSLQLLLRKVISCACSNNNEQLMIAASPTPSLRIQENPRNTLHCSPNHPTVFSFYDRPFLCLVLPLSLFTSFSNSWSTLLSSKVH